MAKPFKYRGKWCIRYTDENGIRRKKSFDEYRDADLALAQEQSRVREVKRGLRSPAPPEKTFNELADYWLANRAPQKRSGHHDRSIIERHLRPAFGPQLIRTLGTADADKYLCDHLGLDIKTVANHLTLLIAMLNLAVDLGWLLRVPRIRKPKVRLFSTDYHYLRTDEEIARVLRAARDEGELVWTLYATAIYTGLREGELAALQWQDVDFNQRLITVQRSFDGPTKAGDVRYVPLLDILLPLLRDWRLRCPGRLLFPNRDGGMHQPSARIFQEVLHRVLDAAGFEKIDRKGKKRHYVVFHDLRHTFASHWVMKGGDIFKLQKILGHKSIVMTMRYAHLAPAAFAGDLGRFGQAAPGAKPASVSTVSAMR